MANYNQVSYGSRGSDVTELQKLLNQNGYGLDEDGIFGSKTMEAVKDYQKKNDLDVDGIVGSNTWDKLSKTSTDSGASGGSYGTLPETSSETSPDNTETMTPTFNYGEYQESDTVKEAEALLNQQLANKPGDYTSAWQTQLNDAINKILNREEFSYDLNGDALYQQYKDKYIQQGQMAMMDTMGQAAALTGGYGNSYAQSVGQQAYQAQLQNLNDIVPELYQLALDKYNQEGEDLYSQYSLLATQEDQDYSRWQDTYNSWLTERDYLAGRYDTERSYDYTKWSEDRDFAYGQYSDDRAYAYQEEQDEFARQEAAANLMAATGDYSLLGQLYGLTEDQIAALGGKTGTSVENEGGTVYNAPTGWDAYDIKAFQEKYGLTADGVWGPESQAKYDDVQAETFIANLPYAHAGSGEQWKNYVDERLEAAYTSGALSKESVVLVLAKLNLA